jgi:hypothetical protein
MAAPTVLTNLGSLSGKPTSAGSQTTSAIGAGTAGSGSLLAAVVARLSASTSSPTVSLTDSAGNTYTALSGASALQLVVGGPVLTLFICQTPSSIVASTTTFTISFSSNTFSGYAMHVLELDSACQDAAFGAGAHGTGTSLAVTSLTPSAAGDYLWLGTHGSTGSGTLTDTIAASGVGTGTLIPTGTSMEGTSGGTTNADEKLGYLGVSASSASQAFNGTLSGSPTGWAAAIAAVSKVAVPPTPLRVPVFPQAMWRSAYR